jgi:phosphatidylinositol-4-phosphate 3-kinase
VSHFRHIEIKRKVFLFSGAVPFSPTLGQIGGAVKLSVSYRNGTLFIMVMHIKDLVSGDKC